MSRERQRHLSAVTVFCLAFSLAAPMAAAMGAPWRPEAPGVNEVELSDYLRKLQAERTRAADAAEKPESATLQRAAEKSGPETLQRAATYLVQQGDTLWSLARRFGVTVENLQEWNGIKGSLIKIGQSLVVAPAERATVASRGGTAFTATLLWPVLGTITSGWGYRTRFEKFHYGLDIAAPTGTPIKAAAGGVVEYSGWKEGYGYCVFLNHGNGLKTAYGHASKLYVKYGEKVAAGQTIAAVGSTGFSTGPHVHLEVRVNDQLVDPATVLPKRP